MIQKHGLFIIIVWRNRTHLKT